MSPISLVSTHVETIQLIRNVKSIAWDTFLQTAPEPRKQRRLDFRSAKQTLVLIQFMVIDFDKFLLSDINWDNSE